MGNGLHGFHQKPISSCIFACSSRVHSPTEIVVMRTLDAQICWEANCVCVVFWQILLFENGAPDWPNPIAQISQLRSAKIAKAMTSHPICNACIKQSRPDHTDAKNWLLGNKICDDLTQISYLSDQESSKILTAQYPRLFDNYFHRIQRERWDRLIWLSEYCG